MNKAHCCKPIFLLLFTGILIFSQLSFAKIIRGIDAEQAFLLSDIINSELKESLDNDLCGLDKNRKIAICNAIMEAEMFRDSFDMYLNKVGITENQHLHNCEEHPLKFKWIRMLETQQKMFPCYGRHDPVRTKWNIDDYYNIIFVSAGREPKSIFIHVRYLFPDREVYNIYGYMTDIDIATIPDVSFSKKELDSELQSLKRWSYNGNNFEIESIYIRNVVNIEYQKRDRVCDLQTKTKMRLCVAILTVNFYRNYYWELNEAAFESSSSDCIENPIQFIYAKQYNEKQVKQKMFPCFGKAAGVGLDYPDQLHISAGFRDNSIMVYFQYSGVTYSLHEFIENVNLDDFFETDYIETGNGAPPKINGSGGTGDAIDEGNRPGGGANGASPKINGSHELD